MEADPIPGRPPAPSVGHRGEVLSQPHSWTRCGDTTTNRAPTSSRSTWRTCARNSAPMSWRRFAAWGTDFGATRLQILYGSDLRCRTTAHL